MSLTLLFFLFSGLKQLISMFSDTKCLHCQMDGFASVVELVHHKNELCPVILKQREEREQQRQAAEV